MIAVGVFLLLLRQEPAAEQVERCLKDCRQWAGTGYYLTSVTRSFHSLGPEAAPALSERLAREIRRGTWSDLTDALLFALFNRPEAVPPLQAVLRDSSLPAEVRVNAAVALNFLNERKSWPGEMAGVLRNELLPMKTRLRAARLFPEGAPELREGLEGIVLRLSLSPLADQKAVIDYLSTEGSGLRDLSNRLLRDRRLTPDIRLYCIDARLRAGDGANYAAMFPVIDEIRAGKSTAAPAAEALALRLADQRPLVEEVSPDALRPIQGFAVTAGLAAIFVGIWAFRKPGS
jgi:hypothetical protein